MQRGSSFEVADRLLDLLYAPLMEDAHRALEQAKGDPSGYNRRVAFRVIFSAIEGLIALLKDHALRCPHPEDEYSAAEIALLREEEYVLDDRGKAKTRTRFIRVADNLLFAWNMYFRALLPNFKPDLSSEGWRSFSASLVTRNKITHPKSGNDLKLSDEDMNALERGFDWVNRTTFANMASALLGIRRLHYEWLNRALPHEVQRWLDTVYSKMASVFHAMKDRVGDVQLPYMEVDEQMISGLEKHGLMFQRNGELWLTSLAGIYMEWRASHANFDTGSSTAIH